MVLWGHQCLAQASPYGYPKLPTGRKGRGDWAGYGYQWEEEAEEGRKPYAPVGCLPHPALAVHRHRSPQDDRSSGSKGDGQHGKGKIMRRNG
jgi:hypothetical protein